MHYADKEGGYPEPTPDEQRAYFRTHDPAEWITHPEMQERYREIFGLPAMLRAVRGQGLCEHDKEEFVHKPAYKVGGNVPEPIPSQVV